MQEHYFCKNNGQPVVHISFADNSKKTQSSGTLTSLFDHAEQCLM